MRLPLATVESAGLATVQDGGRIGFAHVGVPASGALHRQRYLVATSLLHGTSDERCPAVEILAGDLVLVTRAELVLAVVGPARVDIDGRPSAGGAAVLVESGRRVRVVVEGPGPAYLVVAGWTPESTLGSVATDTFSRLGGDPIRAGSELVGDPRAGRDRIGAFHRPLSEAPGPVRLVAAGHRGLRAFADVTWLVTSVARSGVRLAGGPTLVDVSTLAAGSVSSRPVVPGAIQVTPVGEPIVLGPDGGVTGGYPVVAVVATVDLDRMSLLRPGDEVAFRVVSVDEAAQARRDQVSSLRRSIAHPSHLP